jgi:hypothetical protein
MKDVVTIKDRLELAGGGYYVVSSEEADKSKERVRVEGFFSAVCRERGKIVPGTRRQGFNIWTFTGREYLARMMSYAAYGISDTPARNDRIRYVGFGVGTTPEVSSVSHLISPIAYDASSGGLFLAELAIPTYPFMKTGSYGTSVRYTREFSETELSTSTTVILTEAGLFTDGSPTSSPTPFTPRTRDVSLDEAVNQAPAGYRSFDPLKKTQNFVLQMAWEVRF